MPKRQTAHNVTIFRAGKRISIKPGTLVDLTAEEIADIEKANKDALVKPDASKLPKEMDLPPANSASSTTAGTHHPAAEQKSGDKSSDKSGNKNQPGKADKDGGAKIDAQESSEL